MKLLLKFNLVFLVVFAIGFGVAATIARDLLQRDAREGVLDRARLLMEKAVVLNCAMSRVTPVRPSLSRNRTVCLP